MSEAKLKYPFFLKNCEYIRTTYHRYIVITKENMKSISETLSTLYEETYTLKSKNIGDYVVFMFDNRTDKLVEGSVISEKMFNRMYKVNDSDEHVLSILFDD